MPPAVAPEALALLDRANQVYVGVRTPSGPHVTPELFARRHDQIWCMTSPTTLKARRLRVDGAVSLMTVDPEQAVVIKGEAQIIDGTKLLDVLSQPGLVFQSVEGSGRFVAGNLAELTGAARDFFLGRLGSPLQARRVAIAVTPTWAAVVPVGPAGVISTGPNGDDGQPSEAVALGWTDSSGAPVVLPALWDGSGSTATVGRTAFDAVDPVSNSQASVTCDRWTGLGPSGKQGSVMRGRGEVSKTSKSLVTISLQLDRISRWDGVEVTSESIS